MKLFRRCPRTLKDISNVVLFIDQAKKREREHPEVISDEQFAAAVILEAVNRW
jgi:hypothetical protein